MKKRPGWKIESAKKISADSLPYRGFLGSDGTGRCAGRDDFFRRC